jgi:DNA mismatch repair ATPase MutL
MKKPIKATIIAIISALMLASCGETEATSDTKSESKTVSSASATSATVDSSQASADSSETESESDNDSSEVSEDSENSQSADSRETTDSEDSENSENTQSEPWEQPIADYVSMMQTGEAEYGMAIFPQELLDILWADADSSGEYESFEDCMAEQSAAMHDALALEYGDDFALTYEINSAEQLDSDGLADLEKTLSENYGFTANLTDGYNVSATFSVSGSEGEESETDDWRVYEYGGKWYLSLY